MSADHSGHRDSVLVRGVGDVGSAVAYVLFQAGYRVAIHDEPAPITSRRGMAFTDAVFDRRAELAGVAAVRVESLEELPWILDRHDHIPVVVEPFEAVLSALRWAALVDARMRKRSVPESLRGLTPLTVGLGPNFIAGETVDFAIETSWDRLGVAVRHGPTMPLAGEPRMIAGVGRERFVYAPCPGVFRTDAHIGDLVPKGGAVASIEDISITAPIGGALRGLTHDGVWVGEGTKILEVDPRGAGAIVTGLGERPRLIADAVRRVIGTE